GLAPFRFYFAISICHFSITNSIEAEQRELPGKVRDDPVFSRKSGPLSGSIRRYCGAMTLPIAAKVPRKSLLAPLPADKL
ncbi:MAG: hypothetical protein WDZ51_04960, partial [Pirellulaceae bacterium]